MIDSTKRRGSRFTKVLGASGITLLLLATGCSSEVRNGDPQISVKADRNSAGALEALTVTGKRFSPNGMAHITLLLAGGPTNASPYYEEDIQADSDGKIRYEKRPVPCPTATDYGQGSYILVTARDTNSGISGSRTLSPGGTPDCKV